MSSVDVELLPIPRMAKLPGRDSFFFSYGLAWSAICRSVSSLFIGGQSTYVGLHITHRNSKSGLLLTGLSWLSYADNYSDLPL